MAASHGDGARPTFPSKLDLILRRLIWLGAPKVMLITVLCAGCLNVVDIEGSPKDYEVLEFFAGERRLAKLGAGLGKSNASMDKMYDDGDNISKTNAMDLNTSAGFLLACVMVMHAKVDNVISLMGICCSTLVSMSRGSTLRSVLLPTGCPISMAVYKANKAICRSVLLILLVIAVGGVPLVENPNSTLLHHHPRFAQLVNMLKKRGISLYRQAMWMKHFGHACLKRTLLWSTSEAVKYLDLGPIKKNQHKSEVKTAHKYQDRSGKTRYKGAGKDLKGTQLYPPRFVGKILENQKEFLATKPALPPLEDYDLFQALLDMPTGDHWDDAEMWTVFAYVRASKFLEMPEAYKPLLFTRAA